MAVEQDKICLMHEVAFPQLRRTDFTVKKAMSCGDAKVAASHALVEPSHGVLSGQEFSNE